MRAWFSVVAMALAFAPVANFAAECAPSPLANPLSTLHESRFVELTHAFAPDIPLWKGTRVDAPAHLRSSEMVMPLVVIDVHERAARNADYVISLRDVANWEKRHGRIPAGAFVAMRMDWSTRWPNDEALNNWDSADVHHFPGWSNEVLRLLYEKRGISASGHETTDTDPGLAITHADYSLGSYVRSRNGYPIALLKRCSPISIRCPKREASCE